MVVRINASDELASSQPCCMCVHMMQTYGIYRVYYSNDKGEMCYEKVDEMGSVKSNSEDHISKGLSIMVMKWSDFIKKARLPLNKKQKTDIIKKHLKNSMAS